MGVFPDSFERIHTLSLILNMKLVSTLPLLAGVALAETYFKDDFSDGDAWESRWIQSKHKDDYGVLTCTPVKLLPTPTTKVSELAKMLNSTLDQPNSTNSATPVKILPFSSLSNTTKKIDCGGGYVKVF